LIHFLYIPVPVNRNGAQGKIYPKCNIIATRVTWDIHSLQSSNLCSDPHSPLFDKLSSSDVVDKTLSIKREIRNLHSFSHRIISSDTNNHDGESVTRFFDNSYEKRPVAEASPSVPLMEIGDADFDNEIWNQSDS